ncbi:arylsulfatase B-like [Diabrotica virgifera virgifera]|uniref:Arylsulfatase B-like n=1 Tax=Diabrotica virgifera virgifera TaxID=50390 RepID=A0A6P7F2K1_DIAVI|nr:arylsulfatase B-like [Diabrotica virgifera virgifera]
MKDHWNIFWLVLVLIKICDGRNTKPNIIVIMADDMGFNDVGFHGSDEIPTPNIDALAYNGVILNSHYTQSLCTPSRSAFLTGKYPIHTGMQHLVILEPEPWGLPLNETLIPQILKQNGYSTHAVGKWHLGFFEKEYTPTYRGFDTHYGYFQGLQDYYTHMTHASFSNEIGYDMRRNLEVDYDAKGKYSTTLFTNEAVNLIKNHDTKNPMFLYMTHLAPHSGNANNPLQAPDEEIARFAHIQDPERRIYAAMVSMLDQSVGTVISALRDKRMLDNSVILFMSDNGAQPRGLHANHGSNYPFRGTKETAFEGGHRNIAAIWSPLIKKPQRVSNRLMHISDWLPTFYSIAGLNKTDIPKHLDGMDMWESISEDKESPRTEFVYNIDDIGRYGAVRQGDWKYIYGSVAKGKRDTWFGDNGKREEYFYDINQVLSSKAATSFTGFITYQQIEDLHSNKSPRGLKPIDKTVVEQLRREATVTCAPSDPDQLEETKCNLLHSPCLFNIKDDPCERINLASARPNIVKNLEHLLLDYRKTVVPPRNKPRDPKANPVYWNNTWVSWADCDNVFKAKVAHNPISVMGIVLIVGAVLVLAIMILILSKVNYDKRQTHKNQHASQTLVQENNV